MILPGITARFMGYSHSPRRSANDINWPRHPIGAILRLLRIPVSVLSLWEPLDLTVVSRFKARMS